MRKLYIIKKEKDFDTIIHTGRLQKSRNYIIYYKENEFPYDRYGISVGKKIGNAVTRNKYKRKLRAIIDNYKKVYVNSQDYIIILKGSANTKKYKELNEDFLFIMNNIRKDIKNGKEKK